MNIDPSEVRALVRSATKRTGVPLHDEDLEQDAALKAVEAFRRQLEVRYPRAFLRKIVRDAVRDHWRRRRSLEVLDGIDETRIHHTPRLEDELDRRHRTALVRDALASLDSGKRAALELFYRDERSIVEIASIQKRSVSAVKMDLLRARRRLAEIVKVLARRKKPARSQEDATDKSWGLKSVPRPTERVARTPKADGPDI
jgi:RNA polymerase sigma-70 factor (ECF subfamily)